MRRRCFRGLVKTCGEYGILPSSYIIPESKIQKLGDSPISSGGFSDVWPGVYREDGKFESEEDDDEGRFIAIKIIRYCETDDIQTIKKVRCFGRSPSRSSLTVCRISVGRSSPGSVCLTQTY